MVRAGVALGFYFVILICEVFFLRGRHPGGAAPYGLAALPTLAMLAVLLAVGRYLREEPDEYHRDIVVRCMLWGSGAVVVMTFFSSFLRMFGWTGELPPFCEVYVFAVFMLLAKLSYKLQNRVRADE
jgi:hypothetical protein